MDWDCNWFLLSLIFSLSLLRKVLKWTSEPLSRLLTNVISPEPSDLYHLRSDVDELRMQLQSINQMDNFAEHFRAQRVLHQRESQLSSVERGRKGILSTNLFVIQWTGTLLLLLCRVWLVLSYRSVPVVTLSPETVWPLGTVLSFPTGLPGAVGVPAWTLMCTVAFESFTSSN